MLIKIMGENNTPDRGLMHLRLPKGHLKLPMGHFSCLTQIKLFASSLIAVIGVYSKRKDVARGPHGPLVESLPIPKVGVEQGAHSSRFRSRFLENFDFGILTSTFDSKFGAGNENGLFFGIWRP